MMFGMSLFRAVSTLALLNVGTIATPTAAVSSPRIAITTRISSSVKPRLYDRLLIRISLPVQNYPHAQQREGQRNQRGRAQPLYPQISHHRIAEFICKM